MEMPLIYARIANKVVADEYAAVGAQIDALYGQPPELSADYFRTDRVPPRPDPPAGPRPRPRPARTR
jgi:hypothetical protein